MKNGSVFLLIPVTTLIAVVSCVSWQAITLSCYMVAAVRLATGWARHTALVAIHASSAFWESTRHGVSQGRREILCLSDSNTHCSDRWLPSSRGGTRTPQFPSGMCRCWGNAWSRSGYSGAPTGPLNRARCTGNLEGGGRTKGSRLSVLIEAFKTFTEE